VLVLVLASVLDDEVEVEVDVEVSADGSGSCAQASCIVVTARHAGIASRGPRMRRSLDGSGGLAWGDVTMRLHR